MHKITIHESAAYVIGRRGMDFRVHRFWWISQEGNMDINSRLMKATENISILNDTSKEDENPMSAEELQFELFNNPDKYEEFNDPALYEFLDNCEDEQKQLYWVRKSVIRVCREKKLSNNAAKWFADRNASKILEALKEGRKNTV